MSQISEKRQERIKEDILSEMFEFYPKFEYTETISDRVNRDNEFILRLLKELKDKGFVGEINESRGRKIKRKWQLRKNVYETYKELI